MTEIPMATSAMPEPQSRRAPGKPVSFWIALGLGLLLLASLAVNLLLVILLVAEETSTALGVGGLGTSSREKVLEEDAGAEEKIAVIRIKGIIMSGQQGGLFETQDMIDKVVSDLERAGRDQKVKAILLDVDSPGGGITDCDRIHHALKELRLKRSDLRVVALFGGIAASGGYYVSAPADHIMAHPTTVTGSIGVISAFPNIVGLLEKIGVQLEVIKSGDKKDIGSMTRPMTAEERALLKDLIMEMYNRFVDIVDEGRENLSREQVLALADGSIFTGQQALDKGLVDGLGYFDDAVKKAKELAGIDKARVIEYRKRVNWEDFFSLSLRQKQPPYTDLDKLREALLSQNMPRLWYLSSMR